MNEPIKISQHLFLLSVIALSSLIGCFELFPEETVTYEGRIVEDFDSNRPIDSVLVQACTKVFSLFPSNGSCPFETYTDRNGFFHLKFETEGLEGHRMNYSKDGYKSLDSCKTLADGTLECYMEALATFFTISGPTRFDIPFLYDSASIRVETLSRDTLVHYFQESLKNITGGISYRWTTKRATQVNAFSTYTFIRVADNSNVTVEANYFSDGILEVWDSVTLFCPKGIGNRYKILEE